MKLCKTIRRLLNSRSTQTQGSWNKRSTKQEEQMVRRSEFYTVKQSKATPMKKNHYTKELELKSGTILRNGDEGFDVRRVQEWINLYRYIEPAWWVRIAIDEDYGPATETAVQQFQKFRDLTVDGEVGSETFTELTRTLASAFVILKSSNDKLRQLIIDYANRHLINVPRELQSNTGPWVRAYMDGNEGRNWPWCMGFAQTILDQACSTLGKDFTDLVPHTYSCDVVLESALDNDNLLRNTDLRKDASKVNKGDLFLIMKHARDAVHVGIIEQINDNGTFVTIEGNTNDEGSREGFEVCRRIRNYQKQNIDVVLLPI